MIQKQSDFYQIVIKCDKNWVFQHDLDTNVNLYTRKAPMTKDEESNNDKVKIQEITNNQRYHTEQLSFENEWGRKGQISKRILCGPLSGKCLCLQCHYSKMVFIA